MAFSSTLATACHQRPRHQPTEWLPEHVRHRPKCPPTHAPVCHEVRNVLHRALHAPRAHGLLRGPPRAHIQGRHALLAVEDEAGHELLAAAVRHRLCVHARARACMADITARAAVWAASRPAPCTRARPPAPPRPAPPPGPRTARWCWPGSKTLPWCPPWACLPCPAAQTRCTQCWCSCTRAPTGHLRACVGLGCHAPVRRAVAILRHTCLMTRGIRDTCAHACTHAFMRAPWSTRRCRSALQPSDAPTDRSQLMKPNAPRRCRPWPARASSVVSVPAMGLLIWRTSAACRPCSVSG